MQDNPEKTSKETLRETIQLERELIREKIKELIDAQYARLEEEAERIAPDFDYETEGEKLKKEEAEELARIEFEWADVSDKTAADEPEAMVSSAGVSEAAEEVKPAPAEKEKKKKEYGPLPKARVSHSKYPKPARVYKSAAGRALLGDRHRAAATAAAFLLVLFAVYQAWDWFVPKTVHIDYLTFEGTERIDYATTARTAGELKSELDAEGDREIFSESGNGFSFSEADLLETNEDRPIANDTTVSIRHAAEASAKIAGKRQTLWLVPGTVEENLELNGVVYDDDDEIKPSLSSEVTTDTEIRVDEVHYDVTEKTETIESVDKVILDPSLTSGVQETEEGNDGEGIFTYTTRYVNGKDKGTERKVKEWITEPHDSVLRLGTSATGDSGEYIVSWEFTANTTAYTARAGARGALGQTVHVGTCAVDPGYVGLGSELWIEDYGYAYANDTGGAVKGNVVDLYMSSMGECRSWGRRNKTAYVIIPAE